MKSMLSTASPVKASHLESLENRTLFSGGLDPTWGTGGYIDVPVANSSIAIEAPFAFTSIKSLSNRKVLAAGVAKSGGNHVFELIRYNANGSVDRSFGSNGIALAGFGDLDAIDVTLLIQPDGKIVAAGDVANNRASTPVTDIAVARFNSNGTPDQSFGNNGAVLFDGDKASAVLWQDGKLLIGSSSTVRRLNTNGTLDNTFAKGVAGGDAFAVQPDGKILVNVAYYDAASSDTLTKVSRYNFNGSIDTTFGNQGKVISVDDPYGISPNLLVVEHSGTILLADTTFGPINFLSAVEVVALNSNGSANASFGSANGMIVVSSHSAKPPSLIQQTDGQLLLAVTGDTGPIAPGTLGGQYASVTRYSATGQPDLTFGNNGTATASEGPPAVYRVGGPLTVGSLASLDSAGRLLLAGGSGPGLANIFAINTNNDSGSITGYMFYDFNGNGKRDPGDHALNWTCYIDVDNDGRYDNADITIHTDANGNFTIPNLAPGVYHIRQSQVSHWQKTTPAEYTVTVSAGETVTAIAFGSRQIQ